MSETLAIHGRVANLGGAGTCTELTQPRHLNFAIAETLRRVSPRKTWGYLCSLTGLSERSAKYRMSGEREFTADELAALIRSEDGFEFLTALMADAQPAWWRTVRRAFALGDLRRQQQKIREAIDEVEATDRALARAETALASLRVQDEDFARPMADALAAAGRVPTRALAQTTKRRPA